MNNLNNFFKQLDKVEKVYKQSARKMGIVAVQFSKDRFVKQNWVDNRTENWKPRKKRDSGRAVLVKTGALKRSIRVKSVTAKRVIIATDSPYAQVHNEGFRGTVKVKAHKRGRYTKSKKGTGVFSLKTRREKKKTVTEKTGDGEVRAHSRKVNLPRRQFLGDSAILTKNIERQLTADIMKALK